MDGRKVDSGGCRGRGGGRGCLHVTPCNIRTAITTPTANPITSARARAGEIRERLVCGVASGSQACPPPAAAGQPDARHRTERRERHGRLVEAALTVVVLAVAVATGTSAASTGGEKCAGSVGVGFLVAPWGVVGGRGGGGEGQGVMAGACALAGEEEGCEGEGRDDYEYWVGMVGCGWMDGWMDGVEWMMFYGEVGWMGGVDEG